MITTKYVEIVKNAEKCLKEAQNIDVSTKIGDRWSVKEIVGHLIDSAINNYRRFIIASGTNHLVFEGYDQNEWVKIQNYQSREYERLVAVWSELNQMIIDMLNELPEEIVELERANHNLDKIAFKTIPNDQPTNLKYLIDDYYDHLVHHINQIQA